jgi:hypothetical protein
VTSGAGTSASPWIVTRGYDGTTAKTHTAGVTIAHAFSANDFTTAASHYAEGSGSGVHGLPAAAWSSGSLSTINETTVTGSSTNVITWSSIPATNVHLLISVQARLTETSQYSDDIYLTFNGDTGAHYSYLTISSTNVTGSLVQGTYATYAVGSIPAFRVAASEAGSSVNAGGGLTWIPNYAGSAFNKMACSLSGMGDATSSLVDGRVRWGFWNPSAQAAISSISLTAPSGSDFVAGSQFSLYGLG